MVLFLNTHQRGYPPPLNFFGSVLTSNMTQALLEINSYFKMSRTKVNTVYTRKVAGKFMNIFEICEIRHF